jgi:hypothetical protein
MNLKQALERIKELEKQVKVLKRSLDYHLKKEYDRVRWQ